MKPGSAPLRLSSGLLLAALVAAGVVVPSGTALADPVSEPTLVDAEEFSVVEGAAGYELTLNLDAPLPVRDEIPTLYVDGVAVGAARESADGLSLSVTTATPVATASSAVEYAFGALDSGAALRSVPLPDTTGQRTLDLDPASTGRYGVTEFGYDLGAQAVDLRDIGGKKGEFRAQVYLPEGKSTPSPVVVFQHGRHGSCFTPPGTPSNLSGYPCLDTQIEIPSYLGYGSTATKLASHGYAVVSVSVNAINSNDNQLASDYGATARGQIILDHLDYLARAQAGSVEGVGTRLVGALDFSHIGLMGHSRGGEGVARAVQLNQDRETPYSITSVLPLAPVDFSRATTPGVDFLTVLPYCDGDVTSLQGQHMFDDNAELVRDEALRSSVLVLGANHNFFNTTWDPSEYSYSASDDWRDANGTVCSKTDANSIRLSGPDQRQVGDALMAGWFRLTLGGEDQFLPMFDGSNATIDAYRGAAVVSTVAAPQSAKAQVHTFATVDRSVRLSGTASAVACSTAAACGAETLGAAQLPHWAPMRFASAAAGAQVTALRWTSANSALTVDVPTGARDASGFDTLNLQLSPGAGITAVQGLSARLTDAAGKTATVDLASHTTGLTPLPTGNATIGKVILRQVSVPLARFSGVDLARLTTVALVGTASTGNLLVKDLAFQRADSGTAIAVPNLPTVNVSDVFVNEGDGPGEALVGITLSRPATAPVTGRFEVFNGTGTASAQRSEGTFTIPAGKSCAVQSVALNGNRTTSATPTTSFAHAITAISGGITGKNHGVLRIREDDAVVNAQGIVEPLAEDPGPQQNPCLGLNFEATATTADLAYDRIDAGQKARILVSVGSTERAGVTAAGSVTVSSGARTLATGVLSGSGRATIDVAGLAGGTHTLTVSYGGNDTFAASTSTVTVTVTPKTTLSLSPAAPTYVTGAAATTLTARVAGAPGATGSIAFTVDGKAWKTVALTGLSATTALPRNLAVGGHTVKAQYLPRATTALSSTATATLTVKKATAKLTGTLSAKKVTAGKSVSVAVAVTATGVTPTGKVTVTVGGKTVTGTLKNGRVTVKTPTTLKVGSHAVKVSYAGSASIGTATVSVGTLTVTKR